MKRYEPKKFDNSNPISITTEVTYEWSSCPVPSFVDSMRALMINVDKKETR